MGYMGDTTMAWLPTVVDLEFSIVRVQLLDCVSASFLESGLPSRLND